MDFALGIKDFALGIEDFDELVDLQSLYDHFLGPEPSAYVSRLIHREERSKCLDFVLLPHQFFTFVNIFVIFLLCFTEMAIFFSQEKYV